jgi:hypothetical protein
VTAIGTEEFDFFVPELLPMTIKLAFALRAGYPKNFRHGAFPPVTGNNSKSKYRNQKQTRSQITLKLGKAKMPNPNQACFEICVFQSFEFVSNFGFRVSEFKFYLYSAARPSALAQGLALE